MPGQQEYTLIQEEPSHAPERDRLILECFGPPRLERAAIRLRHGTSPTAQYSLVAADHDTLLGSLRFYPLRLPDDAPVLMLGPLAIAPLLRGQGIGRALVETALKHLFDNHEPAVLVIGDAGYFSPFGFSVPPVQALDAPGRVRPLTLMGIEWQAGFLSGQSGSLRPLTD